jgi:hypothetical protein
MPLNQGASTNIPSDAIAPGGMVEPGSELEEASIAAGVGAAYLDIYYPDGHSAKHRHEHGGGPDYGDRHRDDQSI